MAGIKAARRLQLGIESSAGTAVAATVLWRGAGMLEDQKEPVVVENENVGLIAPSDRIYIPKDAAALEMDEIEANFEQLPYLLACGIKDVVTGSADGIGSGKIYAYPFHTSAASLNGIKTATIEGGDNELVEEMEYSFIQKLKISGKPGEALKVGATWVGRQLTATSFTGAIAVPSVEDILFQKGKLYIDNSGGTIGTTQKANVFLGFDLDIDTGWKPIWTGDGNLYFSFIKATTPKIEAKITFEMDAISVAERTNWRNKVARLIRLQFQGAALGTPGTTYSYKTLNIDLYGKWTKFDKVDEIDGNDVVTGTFRCLYNATAAKLCDLLVVNEVAAL